MKIILLKINSLILKFTLTFSFFFFQYALAQNCQNKGIKKLQIACTYYCDWALENALNQTAKKLNIELSLIELIDRPMAEQNSDIDGYIIPGGADIDPAHYLARIPQPYKDVIMQNSHLADITSESIERDQFELKFLDDYFQEIKPKPLYGICRGLQLISAHRGIPLYMDIATELKIPNRINLSDKISKQKNETHNSFFDFLQQQFLGFKWHHQGINYLFPLDNTPFWFDYHSNQGKIIETIEHKTLPIIGTQFHPELSSNKFKNDFFEKYFDWVCAYK